MEEQHCDERNITDKFTTAYEVIERRLEALWKAIDAVDTKTHIALGFASTILVLLAGFYSLEAEVWPLPSVVLFALASVAYIVLVILSILSYRIRGWSYRPDPRTLLEHCKDESCSVADMKHWVANECSEAVYNNSEKLKRKSRLTNYVVFTLALETILLIVGLVYALIEI